MKNLNKRILISSIGLLGVILLFLGLRLSVQRSYSKLFGSFVEPPVTNRMNCGDELRFKFDRRFYSENEVREFLKVHQSEKSAGEHIITKEFLVPGKFRTGREEYTPIDLDTYSLSVERSKAWLSNEKIYSLKIPNPSYKETVFVKVTESGWVSILHCAGI